MRNYTALLPSRWGWFCGVAADPFQSASVFHYGEFGRAEFDVMRQFLPAGGFAMDIGANVGTLSMAMAHAVGEGGVVMAFEPQRLCYLCLCANTALNSLAHIVQPHMVALGAEDGSIGVPPYPLDAKIYNTGGVSLTKQKHEHTEQVAMWTVDSLRVPRCDFIKIDVEGMEGDVLRGAKETVAKYRPPIMCEQLDHFTGTRAELCELFSGMEYKAWKVWTPLHDEDNIKLNRNPVFKTNNDQNIVAVPQDAPDPKLPEMNERLV